MVVFGVTTSPYHLLHTHLRDNEREELMKSFYVDNFLKTYDSVPEMKAECKQVKDLLADAGMPLTGWASNVVELMRKWKLMNQMW